MPREDDDCAALNEAYGAIADIRIGEAPSDVYGIETALFAIAKSLLAIEAQLASIAGGGIIVHKGDG